MTAIIRFFLAQFLVTAIYSSLMEYTTEQKRLKKLEFEARMDYAVVVSEWSNSDIHCVFHYPGEQTSNEDRIMTFPNRPSLRLFLVQYQQENRDIFYFSTNRDSLIVDPNDPNRLVPRMGSYKPPLPDLDDQAYTWRKRNMKKRFDKELAKAVAKKAGSLGQIFYHWFHIGNADYARKNPVNWPL